MKKILFISLIVFSSISASSQNWMTDLEASKKLASEENKKIILVFQGSDWCAPCIKLDREIWSTDEFKTYANKKYVMLKADFPRKKKNLLPKTEQENNNKLAERYNSNGHFPFVVVLDKTGKVLGETGYLKISPSDYINHINSFIK
ncbi:MAG: thioredoxin family protein [Flavobacteriaceae bacterium]|jgi:thioredoxin-related protein|nr:thioredoxin family protein [Flavobacteriaceae bacterium]MBT3920747.1 thioredoxin family protein [Flavobacteriaceae bacterium]MBT6705744.1 thioredoxin family protein [Flavobacteriaceae bacterium]MBT7242164.1 thioredoxin family protein [Flavobacteriaceae bacterium]